MVDKILCRGTKGGKGYGEVPETFVERMKEGGLENGELFAFKKKTKDFTVTYNYIMDGVVYYRLFVIIK